MKSKLKVQIIENFQASVAWIALNILRSNISFSLTSFKRASWIKTIRIITQTRDIRCRPEYRFPSRCQWALWFPWKDNRNRDRRTNNLDYPLRNWAGWHELLVSQPQSFIDISFSKSIHPSHEAFITFFRKKNKYSSCTRPSLAWYFQAYF